MALSRLSFQAVFPLKDFKEPTAFSVFGKNEAPGEPSALALSTLREAMAFAEFTREKLCFLLAVIPSSNLSWAAIS